MTETPKRKRGPGRPSRFDEIIDTRDGTPITVSQRVVELLEAGNYIETAASVVGVDKHTVFEWLRVGRDAARRKQRGGTRLTAHQQRCLGFCTAVDQAQARAEAADVTRLAQAARGGVEVRTITRKLAADGTVLEHVERVETKPIDVHAVTWRLERRFARRWGQRGSLELTAPDGLPLVLDSDVLLAKLRAAQEAHADELLTDDNPGDGLTSDGNDGLSDDGNGEGDGTPEV